MSNEPQDGFLVTSFLVTEPMIAFNEEGLREHNERIILETLAYHNVPGCVCAKCCDAIIACAGATS